MAPPDIMEATVYRATMEEMNDFVELAAKASDMALRCGAVRIDPPPEWNPPPSALLNASRFFVRRQLLPEAPFVDAQFLSQIKSASHPVPKRPRHKADPDPSSNPKQPSSTFKTNNTLSQNSTPPANCPPPPSAPTSLPAKTHPSAPASDSARHSHQPASALPSKPGPTPPSVQTNSFCRLTTKLKSPPVAHQALSPKCGKSGPRLRSQPIAEQLEQNSVKAEPNCATQYPGIRLRSQPVRPPTSASMLVNNEQRKCPPPFANDDVPIPRKPPAHATHTKPDKIAPQRGAWNSASPSAHAPFTAGISSVNTRSTGTIERTHGLQPRLQPRPIPLPPQIANQRPYVPQHVGALPQPIGSQQHRLSSQPAGYRSSIAPTNAITNALTRNAKVVVQQQHSGVPPWLKPNAKPTAPFAPLAPQAVPGTTTNHSESMHGVDPDANGRPSLMTNLRTEESKPKQEVKGLEGSKPAQECSKPHNEKCTAAQRAQKHNAMNIDNLMNPVKTASAETMETKETPVGVLQTNSGQQTAEKEEDRTDKMDIVSPAGARTEEYISREDKGVVGTKASHATNLDPNVCDRSPPTNGETNANIQATQTQGTAMNLNSTACARSGPTSGDTNASTQLAQTPGTGSKVDLTACARPAPTRSEANASTQATRTPDNAGKLDRASCAPSLPMSIQPGTTMQATQTLQGSPDTADKVTVVEDDDEESEVEIKMPSIKRRHAKRKRKPNQTDLRAYNQDGDGKLSKPITFTYSEAPISLKDFKQRTRARLQEMYSLLCADEELQMRISDEGPEWYRDVDRAQYVFWHAMKKGIAGKPLKVDYGVDVEVEGAFDSNEMSYTEWYGKRTRTKSSTRNRKSAKRERVKPKANVNTKEDASGNRKAKKEPHGSQGNTCPIAPKPQRHIRNFNQETLLRLLPRMPGINRSMYYVGQLFTRFCWHTEDGFLNSMSYLHEGSAEKVWYSVPPVNAPDFERYASRNVFSSSLIHDGRSGQQLLMNKTTMFDPWDLMKHGVPVYRVVHKPKSFVITAPRAYHAGFNCGFNVAEAVNFANPTWFPFGREAVSFARHASRPLCIPWEYLLYHEARKLEKTAIPLLAEGCVPPRMIEHARIVARELERIIREGEEKIQKYAERENVQLRMLSGCRALVEQVTIGPEYGYNAGLSCSICGHASHFYAEVCGCCDVSEEARCLEHFGEAAPICDKDGHFSTIVRRHHPVILIDLLDDLERIAGIETSEADQLKRYKSFVRSWKTPMRRSGPVLRIDLVAALSRSVINEAKP